MTTFSTATRKRLASQGKAMSDGSYPTPTLGDLENAVQAWGRNTGSKTALKSYLRRRANALGASQDLKDRIAALKT